MQNQECPLCDSNAEYMQVYSPDGKLFSCNKCVRFFIDSASESYLQGIPEITRTEIRNKLSVSASTSKENHLLVIREPKHEETHGDGHGVARERMIAEWKYLRKR